MHPRSLRPSLADSARTRPTRGPRQRVRRFAAVLLAAGLGLGVTSCGFNDATGRDYTPANGANANEADAAVAVMGAVVVAKEAGTGTLVVTLANKGDEAVSLASVAGSELNIDVRADAFTPIEVAGFDHVNLAAGETGGVRINGSFAPGDFVSLLFGFDNGDQVSLDAPVVADDGHFAGLDNAPTDGTATPEATP